MSLTPIFRISRCQRPAARLAAAFTLTEIVISLAVLGTMSGGAYLGFNAVNGYAGSSRLYSEAQAVAHNQIDIILSKGPFNITSTPYRVPLELMTTAELDLLNPQPLSSPPPVSNQYYPYYRTGLGQPLSKEGFIYTDPVNNANVVVGTLTNSVTSVAASMAFAGVTSDLNVRRATVAVNYTWRSRPYTVSMETLRTADQ